VGWAFNGFQAAQFSGYQKLGQQGKGHPLVLFGRNLSLQRVEKPPNTGSADPIGPYCTWADDGLQLPPSRG